MPLTNLDIGKTLEITQGSEVAQGILRSIFISPEIGDELPSESFRVPSHYWSPGFRVISVEVVVTTLNAGFSLLTDVEGFFQYTISGELYAVQSITVLDSTRSIISLIHKQGLVASVGSDVVRRLWIDTVEVAIHPGSLVAFKADSGEGSSSTCLLNIAHGEFTLVRSDPITAQLVDVPIADYIKFETVFKDANGIDNTETIEISTGISGKKVWLTVELQSEPSRFGDFVKFTIREHDNFCWNYSLVTATLPVPPLPVYNKLCLEVQELAEDISVDINPDYSPSYIVEVQELTEDISVDINPNWLCN